MGHSGGVTKSGIDIGGMPKALLVSPPKSYRVCCSPGHALALFVWLLGFQDGINIRRPSAKAKLTIGRVTHNDRLNLTANARIVIDGLIRPFVGYGKHIDNAGHIRGRWKQSNHDPPTMVFDHGGCYEGPGWKRRFQLHTSRNKLAVGIPTIGFSLNGRIPLHPSRYPLSPQV